MSRGSIKITVFAIAQQRYGKAGEANSEVVQGLSNRERVVQQGKGSLANSNTQIGVHHAAHIIKTQLGCCKLELLHHRVDTSTCTLEPPLITKQKLLSQLVCSITAPCQFHKRLNGYSSM